MKKRPPRCHGGETVDWGVPVFLVLVSAGVLTWAACDRSDLEPPPSSGVPAAGAPQPQVAAGQAALLPAEVVEQVHEHRISNRLGLIEPHLLPDQRAYVIELIQSIDQLLRANDVLKEAVTEHFGPASAEGFDRSQIVNAIGVFSHDVEVLDEVVEGDRASVTIQVAGRVPLEQVRFVRRDGRWMIQTDPPIPGVADEVRRLAKALVDTAGMLDKRTMTAVELKKELDLREAAIGRRLAELTNGAPD